MKFRIKKQSNFCLGVSFISEETAQITTSVYTKVYVEELSHDLVVIYDTNFILS